MPGLKHVLLMMSLPTLTLPAQTRSDRPSPETIARAVDSLASAIVRSGVTPALGVAVVMDGRTILARSYGWADITKGERANDQTLWYLASTSKSFTGFGVSLLAQQRVFRFDDPIATLVPRARWADGVDPRELTLAQFLSHTHYLNDLAVVQSAAFTGAIPEPQWPDLVRYAPPAANRDLVYSNFGYNVAAMAIDAKRPEGWRRYLDSAVFRPAGMRDTYAKVSGLESRIAMPHALTAAGSFATVPFPKRDVTMNAAGGHVATLHDLARWTLVQLGGGVIDGKRVFPAEAVALSHRLIAPHTVEASKRFGPFNRQGWAAGWDVGAYKDEPMVSRFGSYMSTRSHLSMLPGRSIGVVAMVTSDGSSAITDIVAAYAYDLEAGRADASQAAAQRLTDVAARLETRKTQVARAEDERRARQRPLNRPLGDFEGSYRNDALGTITFTLRRDTLQYAWGVLSGPVEIFDADNHIMRIQLPGSGQTVGFVFDGPGRATAVEAFGERFTRREPADRYGTQSTCGFGCLAGIPFRWPARRGGRRLVLEVSSRPRRGTGSSGHS